MDDFKWKEKNGLLVPMTELDLYRTTHYAIYQRPKHTGYTSIEVLEFLKGKPLDLRALDYIHALRPEKIRVTTGLVTCDSVLWRVTVYVDDKDVIKKIEQEVEVGLRTADNGYGLNNHIPKGTYGNDTGMLPMGIINSKAIRKLLKDGAKVKEVTAFDKKSKGNPDNE